MTQRKRMTNVDRAWLRMEEPSNLMMVTALLTTAEPLDYDAFCEVLRTRLMQYNRFRQTIEYKRGLLDDIHWVDVPDFDPADHISRKRIKGENSRLELQNMVSSLMSKPLDYSKPLWHVTMVDNVDKGTALIVRLHHSIADGNALVRVLLSLMNNSPVTVKRKTLIRQKKSAITDPFQKLVRTSFDFSSAVVKYSFKLMTNPSKLMFLLKDVTAGSISLGKIVFRIPDPETKLSGELQYKKLAVWSDNIPLQLIKNIRKKVKGTFNDIIMAAVTGAIRTYLLQNNDEIDGKYIRAAIPVDLRGNEDFTELGNKFGLVFLSLPVGEAKRSERIKLQKKWMDDIKESPEALVTYGILHGMGAAPREIEDMAVNIISSKSSLVMTNVPGPTKPVYLAGTEVDDIMFWVPQAGRVGLGISVISYNNKVRLGVATDSEIIPDPHTFIEGFYEELNAMKKEFGTS